MEVVICIDLVLMIPNYSVERTFSKLKYIQFDCALLWTKADLTNLQQLK